MAVDRLTLRRLALWSYGTWATWPFRGGLLSRVVDVSADQERAHVRENPPDRRGVQGADAHLLDVRCPGEVSDGVEVDASEGPGEPSLIGLRDPQEMGPF